MNSCIPFAVGVKSTLIIAHPGHELRAYGWMCGARPVVHVLTDGSGRKGRSRLGTTSAMLEKVGASCGAIYGQITDRELYRRVLAVDRSWFCQLTTSLAMALVNDGPDIVVGDAEEHQIMAHDLFRGVRLSAIAIAEKVLHRPIEQREFAIDGPPDLSPHEEETAELISLDNETFAAKMTAARGYVEVAPFVDSALAKFGEAAFRHEHLFAGTGTIHQRRTPSDALPYELYGRKLADEGQYEEAVDLERHVEPILTALSNNVDASVARISRQRRCA
jgi:hypothetical protein